MSDHEQFDYWRDAICNSYVHLGCESESNNSFYGKIRLERLSDLSLSFVSTSQQTVTRRVNDISQATDAFFLLSLQLSGHGVVQQHQRRAELLPNDFALYSSVSPYSLKFANSFDQLVVQIPRQLLLDRIPNADWLTARTISGASGLGQMISNHMQEFANSIHASELLVQKFMQENLVDLIATGLASINASKIELTHPDQQILLRAKLFIQSNLSNPYLDRTMVANATGLSVRHLGNAFSKDETSIAAYIRNTRLEKVARDLKDIRFSTQSVSGIAMKWGFNNLQHFSKIFKVKFGQPPITFRKIFTNK